MADSPISASMLFFLGDRESVIRVRKARMPQIPLMNSMMLN